LASLATGKTSPELRPALKDPDLVIAFTSHDGAATQALAQLGDDHLVARPYAPAGRHSAEHLLLALRDLAIPLSWTGTQAVQPLRLPRGGTQFGAYEEAPGLGANDPEARSEKPGTHEPASALDNVRRFLIHPGSGASWKCAPPELFADVAARLVDSGRRVAVIQGPADAAQVVAMGWKGEMIRRRPLLDLADQVLGAAAVIGNDSGVTHLAGVLGVPTVAIFGPTHPDTWRPIGPKVAVVRTCTLPAGPAMRVCDDPDCMKHVSAEMVLDALSRLSAG